MLLILILGSRDSPQTGMPAADALAEEAADEEGGADAEAGLEVQEDDGASLANSLCEPLWKLQGPTESRLKNLQVQAQPAGRCSPL